eukprot:s586_g16.t1
MDVAGCTWSTVKTMIVESQATRLVKEQENRVTAKSLPLEVWLKKGYNEQMVKNCPSEEDANLGTLYAVPVKSTTMKEARQLIEEELQQKEKEEKEVLQKNVKKHKRQAGDAEEKQEEEWDVVPHTPVGGGGQTTSKKAKTEGCTAAASAKAARSAAKATSQANKANEQLTMLASKATGLLSRVLKSTQTLLQQAEKANLADQQVTDLKDSLDRGTTWNKACVSALPLATAAQGTGARLDALPFTNKDLQDYAKATAGLQKQIREDLKKLKPPKVATGNQEKAK